MLNLFFSTDVFIFNLRTDVSNEFVCITCVVWFMHQNNFSSWISSTAHD